MNNNTPSTRSFILDPVSTYEGETVMPLTLRGIEGLYDTCLMFTDKTWHNISQLNFWRKTGYISKFVLINSTRVKIHNNNFDLHRYLQIKMAAGISLSSKNETNEIRYIKMEYIPQFHVYHNIILVLISDVTPRYILSDGQEAPQFGVLTDKNFTVAGFIFWVSNPKIRTNFIENIWHNHFESLNTLLESPQFLFDRKTIMENKSGLIKKIIELKNINIYHLLYYGIEKEIIDNQFLIDYAYAKLVHDPEQNDQFLIELAGLLPYEISTARTLLLTQVSDIDNVMHENGQYYNKIWFYLSLAADMHADKIID